MKRTRYFCKQIITILWIFLLTLSLAGCGGDNGGGTEFEVISAIDLASVTEKDGTISFTSVGKDGMTIRFEGVGITVEEGCIVMQPGAKLISLDYVGKLMQYTLRADAQEFEIDFGMAFTDQATVESMTDLSAAIPFGTAMTEEYTADVSAYDTGFLVLGLNSNNVQAMTLSALTLVYDPSVPQTLLSELDPAGEAAMFLHDTSIRWDDGVTDENMEVVPESIDVPEKSIDVPEESMDPIDGSEGVNMEETINADQLALRKIEGPNVLRSDIIAGIDHSSIVTDGSTTFFSSTMSDGVVVRFEAENIDISEAGMTIHPDSVVTSLDAVGKIYAYFPCVENRENYEIDAAMFSVGYGYTYSASKTSVERAEEVHTYSIFPQTVNVLDGQYILSTAAFDPNFLNFGGFGYCVDSFLVSSLTVCYDPTEKVTAMTDATLNLDFYPAYLVGDRYDASAEQSLDLTDPNMKFYLMLKPDTEIPNTENNPDSIWYVPEEFFEIGALRDAAGNELDKNTAVLSAGCTLDITAGDSFIQMPLPILERYTGGETMNDLVPYGYPEALGDLNTLVVPVIWADQKNMASDETLKLFREGIGRVVDESGTVTDYSITTDEKFSLSEYYDTASYGKMKITSFMTDWYYSEENFADVYMTSLTEAYANNIMDWVRETYPDMDWSKYDQDANGYVDSMIILNAGVLNSDELYITTYAGALNYRYSYYGDRAGTQDAPRVNTYTSVGYSWIQDDYSTIIHEFAHGLGLIDYYDVSYSGIDAVGGFDMQSGSYGDWNAYSKLAVGWMDPQIVEGLASGESVEYTIGSSALTDDVIIIPAAGSEYDGPFSEYVMIDLFTDDGVNEYDADAMGLANAAGVRISHVNANMEKRTNTIDSVVNPGESAEYTIGTIHIPNSYNESGHYNIEVIQAGGDNTFTDLANLNPQLTKEDLFYAGATFTVDDYDEFFNDGLMDDGSAFGYTVEVVSIGTDASGVHTATIRITAK